MRTSIELICVFDLETTGLNEDKHGIVEIACCMLDNKLQEVGEYTSGIMAIYDDREITDKALECNGITRKQIANGRDSKEVIKELTQFLKSFKKTPAKIVLAGHNIDHFDIPHLDNFFTYHKKDLSKFVSSKVTIDTMWWARLKWLEMPNYQLATCCNEVGVTLMDGHRALNDTRANKDLVKSFLSSLRGEGGVTQKEEKRARVKFEF